MARVGKADRFPEHVSLSRVRRRRRCARMDWWHTEGARDGYRANAPVEARTAFTLKRMTSLPAVVGQVVHEAAATRARAVRDGFRPPAVDAVLGTAYRRLNAAVRPPKSGHLGEAPLLREILHGEWPEGRIPSDVAAATKHKVERLLHAMLAHPVWADLARCGRGDILVCDALDAHAITIDGCQVDVFAAPDLVWTSREVVTVPEYGIPLRPPVLTVLDWKTGAGEGRIDAAREQLSVYAWWVRAHVSASADIRHLVGRVADLSALPDLSDLHYLLDTSDVARGQQLIEEEARAIVAERAGDGHVPMATTARNLGACALCPFPPLCR